MSEYIAYTLTILKNDQTLLEEDKSLEIIKELRSKNEDASHQLDESGANWSDWSWNDIDIDMMEFSKKYPYLIFMFNANSSCVDNEYFILYFKDGKRQYCGAEIVYEQYDPEKLTNKID